MVAAPYISDILDLMPTDVATHVALLSSSEPMNITYIICFFRGDKTWRSGFGKTISFFQ